MRGLTVSRNSEYAVKRLWPTVKIVALKTVYRLFVLLLAGVDLEVKQQL